MQIYQNKPIRSHRNADLPFSVASVDQRRIESEDDDESGESKLEIIEESQEEASLLKEGETMTHLPKKYFVAENKESPIKINQANSMAGTRMKTCLMDDTMSSKEAVESLLLFGQEAVVGNSFVDPQTGVSHVTWL